MSVEKEVSNVEVQVESLTVKALNYPEQHLDKEIRKEIDLTGINEQQLIEISHRRIYLSDYASETSFDAEKLMSGIISGEFESSKNASNVKILYPHMGRVTKTKFKMTIEEAAMLLEKAANIEKIDIDIIKKVLQKPSIQKSKLSIASTLGFLLEESRISPEKRPLSETDKLAIEFQNKSKFSIHELLGEIHKGYAPKIKSMSQGKEKNETFWSPHVDKSVDRWMITEGYTIGSLLRFNGLGINSLKIGLENSTPIYKNERTVSHRMIPYLHFKHEGESTPEGPLAQYGVRKATLIIMNEWQYRELIESVNEVLKVETMDSQTN